MKEKMLQGFRSDIILCFVEKIHARNIKYIPFFTPLPSFLFLVVSCFCAACLREEFGGWGPFYLIADLRVFSVWCMLAWKFIFSTKHCTQSTSKWYVFRRNAPTYESWGRTKKLFLLQPGCFGLRAVWGIFLAWRRPKAFWRPKKSLKQPEGQNKPG